MKDRLYLKIKNAELSDIYERLVYLEKLNDMECQTYVDSISIAEPMRCIILYAGSGKDKRFISFEKESFIKAFEECLERDGYEIIITKRGEVCKKYTTE